VRRMRLLGGSRSTCRGLRRAKLLLRSVACQRSQDDRLRRLEAPSLLPGSSILGSRLRGVASENALHRPRLERRSTSENTGKLLDEELLEEAIEAGSASAVPYLFPRHPGEIDRLDMQHYGLRQVWGGNYLAPIGRPDRVLDVGCGTGQWGFELCQQFPDASGAPTLRWCHGPERRAITTPSRSACCPNGVRDAPSELRGWLAFPCGPRGGRRAGRAAYRCRGPRSRRRWSGGIDGRSGVRR